MSVAVRLRGWPKRATVSAEVASTAMSAASAHRGFDRRRRGAILIVLLAIVSCAAFGSVRNSEIPFVLVFGVASLWACAIVALSRSDVVRNTALVTGTIFLGFALVEYGAYRLNLYKYLNIKNRGIWRQANIGLGLENVPNATAESREYFHDRLVFDATYIIDGNGLRKIPQSVQGGPHTAAFFGCSYMFGHGLNNDQTIPYYFLRDADRTFEGFNFSAHGWGAHQMLRELQTGLVWKIMGHPQLAFYEGLTDHIKRAATGAYEPFGPRYALDGDSLDYLGPFHGLKYKWFLHYFGWNWTFRMIQNDLQRNEPNASEIPLYLAIMTRVRRLLEDNGARFIVIFWDKGHLAQIIVKRLRENGFEVVRVSEIIPDFGSNPIRYELSPLDDHPSAKANHLIADYLWQRYGQPLIATRSSNVSNSAFLPVAH